MTSRSCLKILLALALLSFGFGASRAHALESSAVASPRNIVTLVSDSDAIEPGKAFELGLRFRLTPGWHIYWLNPGDSGQAPDLHLALPPGATASDIVWPAPVRLPEGPDAVFAYTGEIVLPVKVTASDAGAPLSIDAKANWLVCAKECIPEKGEFHLSLPFGSVKPSAEAPLFAASAARTPRPSPFTAQFDGSAVLHVRGEGLSPQTVKDAWVFPDSWGVIVHAAPQRLSVGKDEISLALQPGPTFDPKAGFSGILVLKDRDGQESYFGIKAPASGMSTAGGDTSLPGILLFAFLGGLILNLMPCVFPILAIKVVALAKLSGSERRVMRGHALSYTLGVLIAFSSLGGVLIVLRAAGSLAGWGFQFQSPAFVTAMAWLLFALGLNLSGIYRVGGSLAGIGQELAGRSGHIGSFFAGLLAVVVATPCTAPFMGAAIAAALAAPAAETLAIFSAMGIGLAFPYAFLSGFPKIARAVLPKPGRWMDIFRQLLAFPMYGAAAWLVWVISQQRGPDGVLTALTGIILVGLVAWLLGLADKSRKTGRTIARGFAGLSILAALALLCAMPALSPSTPQAEAMPGEEPYSSARFAELRAADKPVFVNMTASWCITCLVNEHVALSTDDVKQAFARHHITYLKGDWTQQNPEITRFLQEHGRDGVPLYVLYPAGHAAPMILPQILTETIMLDAINRPGS